MKYIFNIIIIFSFIFLANSIAHANLEGDNIIISEIEYDPIAPDQANEWFELYNPTEDIIDISGWTFTDGEGVVTIPSATTIASGDYFIATHTANLGFLTNYPLIAVNLEYGAIDVGSIYFANSGDELSLLDSDSNIIDSISWGGVPRFDISAIESTTLTRSTSIDTDAETDWLNDQIPSPGAGTLLIIESVDEEEDEGDSSNASSRKKGGKIKFTCNDEKAINYNRFGRHKSSLCEYSTVTLNFCDIDYSGLISFGSNENKVKEVQNCLKHLGYLGINTDGMYTYNTFLLVKKYQSDNNLIYIDGVVGPETVKLLND